MTVPLIDELRFLSNSFTIDAFDENQVQQNISWLRLFSHTSPLINASTFKFDILT